MASERSSICHSLGGRKAARAGFEMIVLRNSGDNQHRRVDYGTGPPTCECDPRSATPEAICLPLPSPLLEKGLSLFSLFCRSR